MATTSAADPDSTLGQALRRWLLPEAPTEIARRYATLLGVFLVAGLIAAVLMRLELLTPQADLVPGFAYKRLFSLHGMLMVYVVLLPAIPGVIGNALLPDAIGARRLAFPRLANAAWHLLGLGGLVVLGAFLSGGVATGWSFDYEFSGAFPARGLLPVLLGVLLAAAGLMLLALNIATTVLQLRAPGVPLLRGSPLALALLLSSLLALPALGFLVACLGLAGAAAAWHLPIFEPTAGGDPTQFVGLFRMFSLPVLAIVALPCLGLVTEIIHRRVRRPVGGFGIPLGLVLFAGACLMSWRPRAELTAWFGMSAIQAGIATALAVAALFAILGNWLASLRSGLTRLDAAMVYALGFVVALATAASGSLLLLQPGTLVLVRQTTCVTGMMHLLATAALGFAFLGGIYLALPAFRNRVPAETDGRWSAMVIIVAAPLTFLPTMVLGLNGLVVRQQAYFESFQMLQVLATAGMSLLLSGVLAAAFALLARRHAATAM